MTDSDNTNSDLQWHHVKLGDPLYSKCTDLQSEVFNGEQQIPISDILQHLDDSYSFFLANKNGEAIATARFRKTNNQVTCQNHQSIVAENGQGYKCERVAVLKDYRGKGIGQLQIKKLIKEVKEYRTQVEGNEPIYVHSMLHAWEFWKKLGFVVQGNQFEEAGYPHYHMILDESLF